MSMGSLIGGRAGWVVLLCATTALEAHAVEVSVRDHERLTAYHSAQTPGYTSWVGLWTMPDGSVMLSFTEITGSTKGWRQRAPESVLWRLPEAQRVQPAYDMTGLVQENVYLRSTDGGTTWQKISSDPFSSAMNGYCVGGLAFSEEGMLLRRGWGQALTYCDVQRTGFVQRSTDTGLSWGPPEYLSDNPGLQTFPVRLRRLSDGRIILTGGAAPYDPETWQWDAMLPKVRHCLWVALDDEVRTWSEPLYAAPDSPDVACEEWDVAELPDGDLLAVFRAHTYNEAGKCVGVDRRQSILTRDGDTWRPGAITRAPFPHSGMPELFRMREGVILHLAPPGIHWTADRGATWTRLNCPGTGYYPRSVQIEDGTILVASHIGGDDPYGKADQSVVLDQIRLSVE